MHAKRIGLVLLAVVAGAVWMLAPAAVRAIPRSQGGSHHDGLRTHGDPLVLRGLVVATASMTNQRPRLVREQLKSGKSIEAIAQAAGKRAADVLARFDAAVDMAMARNCKWASAAERCQCAGSMVQTVGAAADRSARSDTGVPGLARTPRGADQRRGRGERHAAPGDPRRA